jgi:hypothetical protein
MEGHGGHGGGGFGGHSGGGGGEAHESHVSHSSSSGSSVGPTLEHIARTVLPIAATVAEALTAGAVETPDPMPGAPACEIQGPLIDNGDPCNRCPEDFACDQCTGIAGAACTFAPAGAFSRCGSPR